MTSLSSSVSLTAPELNRRLVRSIKPRSLMLPANRTNISLDRLLAVQSRSQTPERSMIGEQCIVFLHRDDVSHSVHNRKHNHEYQQRPISYHDPNPRMLFTICESREDQLDRQ